MSKIILDIETSKIVKNDYASLRLVAIGDMRGSRSGFGDGFCYIIDHAMQTDFDRLQSLREFYAQYDGLIIGQNLTFDIGVLLCNGFTFEHATFFDTMIALRHINENETRIDLKSWATYLGMPTYADDFKMYMNGIGVENMPIPLLKEYNINDLEATRRLYEYCTANMQPHNMCCFNMEMEVLPIIAKTINHGIGADRQQIAKLNEENKCKQASVEIKIAEDYGAINFNSPPQVAALLYDDLAIPLPLDKHGEPTRSTAEDIMKRIKHPVAKQLMERKKLETERTKFLEKLDGCMDDNNIIHPRMMIYGTETGRLSVRNPPMQTIPEYLRSIFFPQNGWFIWPDLSQIEFRIAMDLAGETDIIREIKGGLDVHSATALTAFDEVTPELRKQAKMVNFLLLYGGGIYLLAERLGVSVYKAKQIDKRVKEALARTLAWQEHVHRQIERDGRVETPFGRTRDFMIHDDWRNGRLLKAIQREGFNFIMQSMGHDCLTTFWIWLDKQVVVHNVEKVGSDMMNVEYSNEVHDELLIDCAKKDSSKVTKLCSKGLDMLGDLVYNRFSYRFNVPITGSITEGEQWK